MAAEACLLFHPFRLDPANEQLWRGEQPLPLRPKPFAILRYLVEHADHLVTKADLLAAVWQNTHVAEGVLRGYIRDLRAALGDNPVAPRFIETVDRRGYRFIAPLTTAQSIQGSTFNIQGSPTPPLSAPRSLLPVWWGGRRSLRSCAAGWSRR